MKGIFYGPKKFVGHFVLLALEAPAKNTLGSSTLFDIPTATLSLIKFRRE